MNFEDKTRQTEFPGATAVSAWQTTKSSRRSSEPPRLRKWARALMLGFATLWVAFALPSWSAESGTNAPSLDPHLEPLRPLLDKTWRGVFKSSKPEKPVVDVMRAERALNGRAVRALHSINDGSYGGETIYRWDEVKKTVTFHYFTTAGFMTTGTLRFEGQRWIAHEIVSGNSGGATEVKATCEFRPDGVFVVKAEYLRNGEWGPGRETEYREDPTAKVVFK